jgi:hypothetical protein
MKKSLPRTQLNDSRPHNLICSRGSRVQPLPRHCDAISSHDLLLKYQEILVRHASFKLLLIQ